MHESVVLGLLGSLVGFRFLLSVVGELPRLLVGSRRHFHFALRILPQAAAN